MHSSSALLPVLGASLFDVVFWKYQKCIRVSSYMVNDRTCGSVLFGEWWGYLRSIREVQDQGCVQLLQYWRAYHYSTVNNHTKETVQYGWQRNWDVSSRVRSRVRATQASKTCAPGRRRWGLYGLFSAQQDLNCILPASPEIVQKRGKTETEIKLLVGQVMWLVLKLCGDRIRQPG